MYSGQLLKKFRNLLDLKQEVVAKNLDVSQQYIVKIEKKENVGEEALVKYLGAMKTTKEAFDKFINFFNNWPEYIVDSLG